MTVVARDENEIWTKEDGAPQGPPFEVTVRSKSRPDVGYLIVRDEQGGIWHPNACERWRFAGPKIRGVDRRMCRHVREALELADNPERVFLNRMMAAWLEIQDEASADDLIAFWTDAYNSLLAARELRWRQLGLVRQKAGWEALSPEEKVAEALSAFGDRSVAGLAAPAAEAGVRLPPAGGVESPGALVEPPGGSSATKGET